MKTAFAKELDNFIKPDTTTAEEFLKSVIPQTAFFRDLVTHHRKEALIKYEDRIIEKCSINGWTYKGYIHPFDNVSDIRDIQVIIDFGETIKSYTIRRVTQNDFIGYTKNGTGDLNIASNLILREKEIKAICDSQSWIYCGLVTPLDLKRTDKISALLMVNGCYRTATTTSILNGDFNGSNRVSWQDYEDNINAICLSKGWKFNGFILPIPRHRANTKLSIAIGEVHKTPLLTNFVNGHFSGSSAHRKPPKKKPSITQEQYIEKSKEFFRPLGFDVLGVSEEYRGTTTKLKLRCHCHGLLYEKTSLHSSKKNGGLTCPETRRYLSSINNGYKNVVQLDEHTPVYLYIMFVGQKFIKFGITCHESPMTRLKQHQKTTNEQLILHSAYLFNPGWQAGDLETGIKKHIKGKRISRRVMTGGFTETLPISKLGEVKQFIADYIKLDPHEPIYFDDNPFETEKPEITDDEVERHFEEMALIPTVDDVDLLEGLDLSPLETL